MATQQPSKRRLKVSSSVAIQSESLTQKVVDHHAGTTKVIEAQGPHHFSSSASVVFNPVEKQYKATGVLEPQVTKHAVASKDFDDLQLREAGFDTSQL